MILVNDSFVAAIEKELQSNESQGPWREWTPTREQLVSELEKHLSKLRDAVRIKPILPNSITEHAADLASLAMKASELYGTTPAKPDSE